jgi:hypothetical protein
MNELHDLLARATDRVDNPRLEHEALQVARRRRTRRRGAAAAAVASALVVTVVVGVQGVDRVSSPQPAAPTHTTPTSPLEPTPPPTPSHPDDVGKVWPEWDPREVDQLPAAPDEVAPSLPRTIAPPPSSPQLNDSPIDAAVVAVEQDGVAQVLGPGGEWRTVPIAGRYPTLSLSPRGTRLAISYYLDGEPSHHDYGVTVHDLASGAAAHFQVPDGFVPRDDTGWSFYDEDTLLLVTGTQAYTVDARTGETAETTAPSGMEATLDPEGNWLTSADFDQPNILTDHAGGTPRDVSMDRTGRLSRLQANEDTVVGTTYDDQQFSVVVADRETLTPQHRLPVLDPEANYSNWGLGTLALADDGTVLLRVAKIGRRGGEGSRVVAWKPSTGELSIVSTTALPIEALVVYATGALRESR